ncbi:MAG TPA: phosphoglycerate mutase family protein [Chitinophagaceae bacterium]|nr:phosphoglycerate mutase family protein [Chitinophagaceae bacterium]
MKYFFTGLVVCFTLLSCSNYYYIVRHAEKAAQGQNMSSDVPLTEAGEQRAAALKEVLENKHIKSIYSTNTIRTKSTAQPTADFFGLSINKYGPRPDSSFINLLKSKKENVLIVGHSNTVDDIVNMLCGEAKIPNDLADHQYDNLFVVKRKGQKFTFLPQKFGKPSE